MTQLQLIALLIACNMTLIYWLNQHTELPGSLPSWARAALLLVIGTVVDPGLELWRAGSTFAEAFVPGLIAAAPAALLLALDTWAGVRTKVKAAARTAAKVAAGSLVLLVTGCGLFTPGAKSPCPGLYCLSLEVAGVPGAALLCYQTEVERDNARIRLAVQGCQLSVDAEQQQRATCPRGVTP